MNKKLLVEWDPHQTRVAMLEADRVVEVLVERRDQAGIVGNVYQGRVTRVLPGMQAAFVDIGVERDAFLYQGDVLDPENGPPAEAAERVDPRRRPIEEMLRPGDDVVVQVTRDQRPGKGARVTSHLSLPSRHLVLMPAAPHLGLSRRIEDPVERERLLSVLREFGPRAGGLIARTSALGQSAEVLAADLGALDRSYQRILAAAKRSSAPTLLHAEPDLVLRTIRDHLSADFSAVVIEGDDAYRRVLEYLEETEPGLLELVRADHAGGLLERYGVEAAIEAALEAKVWLKSGGYLVIHQTEALVAIDVNTGRFTGGADLEDTVRKTNLAAVSEIVRQIRLRDLGGILVVDFIDMTKPEHREQVYRALEAELRGDRAHAKLSRISEFGLIEITRKRSSSNLEQTLLQACPVCAGRGRILSAATVCHAILRSVRARLRAAPRAELSVLVHPDVAQALQTTQRGVLDEMNRAARAPVLLSSDRELHPDQFELTAR